MAISEEDILRDTNERNNLQRAISDLETAIAVSNPGTRRILELSLAGAKARVTTLDKKIEEAKVEWAAEVQAQVAAAAVLAAKETALSASERETYTSFLQESYFTKKDFGKLDEFYTHSYDRLSEGGKDEMSKRIWEGIRRDEYKFTDLPEVTQAKEARRVYDKLNAPSVEQDRLIQIPEADRTDFIRAYEGGNRKQAAQVLTRDSFKQNVALETSAGAKHSAVTTGKTEADQAVLGDVRSEQPETARAGSSAMASAGAIAEKLKGVTLADSTPEPSVAMMPDASTLGVKRR